MIRYFNLYIESENTQENSLRIKTTLGILAKKSKLISKHNYKQKVGALGLKLDEMLVLKSPLWVLHYSIPIFVKETNKKMGLCILELLSDKRYLVSRS